MARGSAGLFFYTNYKWYSVCGWGPIKHFKGELLDFSYVTGWSGKISEQPQQRWGEDMNESVVSVREITVILVHKTMWYAIFSLRYRNEFVVVLKKTEHIQYPVLNRNCAVYKNNLFGKDILVFKSSKMFGIWAFFIKWKKGKLKVKCSHRS